MSFDRPHEESPLVAPRFTANSAILIVDEDPAFQLGLKTFLREYVGFEKVFVARGGQEALDFLRSEPSIGVVTVDYHMPGMNGIEFIDALSGLINRPLAVLMITGYPSEDLEREFRARGSERLLISHFISKPVQFEKLEHIILAAHDEVIDARERAAAARAIPLEEPIFVGSEEEHQDLVTQLEVQSGRLGELEKELRRLRGKWRADFWKLALVLLAFWIAGQFGLREKVEPHWTKLKDEIRASFSLSPTAKPSALPKAVSAPAPKAAPVPKAAPPARLFPPSGQPL